MGEIENLEVIIIVHGLLRRNVIHPLSLLLCTPLDDDDVLTDVLGEMSLLSSSQQMDRRRGWDGDEQGFPFCFKFTRVSGKSSLRGNLI